MSEDTDQLLLDIADYVAAPEDFTAVAYQTARLSLIDSLGCAVLAASHRACQQLLLPVVPEAVLAGGARVPGTSMQLDPVQGAFILGSLIRWLDYNDTWLASEWGHPSDNLGGILAVADYLSRRRAAAGQDPLHIRDVLNALINAYEIQGVLALENSFNQLGLDHVILVRVASAAIVTQLLGGSRAHIVSAVSHAWIDGDPLRVYRHSPNVGPRKSWAAGDATSRGVWLALMAMRGEPGYPTALTTPNWGYQDALNRGRVLARPRPFGSYIVENVLFKVSYPAEFHAQTSVEAAVRLHDQVGNRVDSIERIVIETQQPALRIIDKRGPLRNPADRDHCLQYVVAVGLLRGDLTADDYEDEAARDPRIDFLRERMEVMENPRYSRDYLDEEKRSVANALQVFFTDGTSTEQVQIEYPIGHPRRRQEAEPLLWRKFQANLAARLPEHQVEAILSACSDPAALDAWPVHNFIDLFVFKPD
ncbi:MAG TPA: bifunctional 2-methylcitrate dehydratase/aconitate hydratase [Chloroflexota bacterium]